MDLSVDLEGNVALVTGASGALGSAVCDAFSEAGATVCGTDVRAPTADTPLDPGTIDFYEGDFTEATDAERVVDEVVETHGKLDHLLAIAGTWQGGDHVQDTDVETFDLLVNVNLKTLFLAAKHAIPALHETEGTIVTVSSRSSLEGGTGDAIYRSTKAGVRLLTESIAEENAGVVRANAVMPSIIDTPANRQAMPDAHHDDWVDPADIARTMLVLSSDGTPVTSGASIPVYGTA